MQYPVLDELQSALVDIVPAQPVNLTGEWTSSRRRTYQSDDQVGSGSGPFMEIDDTRWIGSLECSIPVACLAFLRTPDALFWARSHPASTNLSVELSVHAYADYMRDRATFASTVGGARLPSLAMSFTGDVQQDVSLETTGHATGRLARLANVDRAEILVCMIPDSLIKVGRKRIWHVRSEVAAALPASVRDLLTRGRSGHISQRM